jgi:hypothetical protein
MHLRRLIAQVGTVATIASTLSVGATAFTSAALAVTPTGVNVDITNFDASGLSFAGSATTVAGNAAQLTDNTTGDQAGAFWLTTPIDTARDFSSHFLYNTTVGAGDPGDGLTFTVQNAGTSALGACGFGLGYGTSPCNSNDAITLSEAYGLDALGSNRVLDGTNGALSDPSISYVDPHDGTSEQAWVDYDAAAHTLKLFTAAGGDPKPADPTATRAVADLSTYGGSTYAGFTGGTGTNALTQVITSWSFHQPLLAPGSVTAVAGAAGAAAGHAPVNVSWTLPADDTNSSQVTSYSVYRSSDPAVRGGLLGTVNVSDLADTSHPSFVDNTGKGGAVYYYTVTDTFNGLASPGTGSNKVTAPKTLPSAPLNAGTVSTVSGSNVPVGGGSVTIGWDAPTDFGGDPDVAFDIFRSYNNGGYTKIQSGITPGSTVGETYEYNDQNLPSGHYDYKIQAVNTQGNSPDSGVASADIVTAASAPTASATAPQDPHLALDGQGRTDLSWSAPADLGGSSVDHYTVYRAIGDESTVSSSFSLYQDNISGTSIPTETLAAGTGFVSYYVVAVMANDSTSAQSATVTVFIPEAPVVDGVANTSNGRVVVTGSVPNLPGSVSVTYAALAYGPSGECTTCVSTPDGGTAVVDGLGSGAWQFKLVPTTSYQGNTAQGPASSLSASSITLHTIRYVSAPFGDDANGNGSNGNDCTIPTSDVSNALGQATSCSTIGQALAQATPGDEILVGPGTYNEGADISANCGFAKPKAAVVCSRPRTRAHAALTQGSYGFVYDGLAITQPVQLIADPNDSQNNFPGNNGPVVINASGHNNGLVVDMGDNFDNNAGVHGVSAGSIDPDVIVSGFTIENANAEGLFAFNSDALRIANNIIQNNDKGSFTTSIQDNLGECAANGPVPGDCGEGLHLDGVTRSVIIANTVRNNSGGILVDDGLFNFPGISVPTEGNTITRNTVVDNSLDCGITVAAHDLSNLFGGFSLGIFNNVISNNVSSGNGGEGEGAGVLLAVGAPGDAVYQNTIRGNILENDGLPGVTIHAHEALAYMDDNVIESNRITSTGTGGTDGVAGDPDAGANGTTGIVVLGLPADPIGGTIIQDNVISAVHYGIFLNEASRNLSGNAFNGVSVPVTSIPVASNVYALRGKNGHLLVNRGAVDKATDLGGAPASAPAVAAVPTWDPNAFGPGVGYWTGTLSPIYAVRNTVGRIAVRSTSVNWVNLAAPTSGGQRVVFTGSPSIVGSTALDNGLDGGDSLLGVAAISNKGDLWLTSVVVGPALNVTGVSQPWRNFGRPGGTTLVGTPALTGLFFTNTAFAAAKNGSLYSLAFDPSSADWHAVGNPWVKRAWKATTVAASTAPDGYRTALVLGNLNGANAGLKLTRVDFVNGVAGRLLALNVVALGQPGVAVATNAVTTAFAAVDGELHTVAGSARDLETAVAGGVSAVALN